MKIVMGTNDVRMVLGAAIAVSFIGAILYFYSKKEKFMIAKEPSRCSLAGINKTSPLIDHENAKGEFPDSIIFVIQGYNYATTPLIYKDGIEMTPLQYSWDPNIMTYYIRVDTSNPEVQKGDLKNNWILETSDYIEPIIYEGDSGKQLKVNILRRRGSFHLWKISSL